MNAPEPSSAQPSRKRSLWGCLLVRGPLGCLAVCVGAIGTFVLLLPTLVEGFVGGALEGGFNEAYQGHLEVGAAKLSWWSEQRIDGVELSDPSGARIARAALRVPSLGQLLNSGGHVLRPVVLELEADLFEDDAGQMNLLRAFAPRPGTKVKVEGGDRDGSGHEDFAWPEDLQADLRVVVKKLSWSDRTTRARGAPFAIEGLEAQLRIQPGEPAALTAKGTIAGASPGAIWVSLSVPRPASGAAPRVDGEIALTSLSTGLIDALAAQGGRLSAALGERCDLKVRLASAGADGGRAELQLLAPRAEIALAAHVTPSELSMEAGDRLEASLEVGPELLASLLGDERVAELGLAHPRAERVRLSAQQLYLPFGAATGAGAAADAGIDALLQRARAELRIELGSWSLAGTQPALALRELRATLALAPAGAGAGAAASANPAKPANTANTANTANAPAAALTFALRGQLRCGAEPERELSLDAHASDLAPLLAVAAGRAAPPIEFGAQLRGLPMGPLAELSAQPALRAHFGEALALELSGALRAPSAASVLGGNPLQARLDLAGSAPDSGFGLRLELTDLQAALALSQPLHNGLVAALVLDRAPVALLAELAGRPALLGALGARADLDLRATLEPAAAAHGNRLQAQLALTPLGRAPVALTASLSDLQALLAALAEAAPGALPLPPELELALALKDAPVALVEALAASPSLADLIGPALDFEAQGTLTRAQPGEPLHALAQLKCGPTLALSAQLDARLTENASPADTFLPFRKLELQCRAQGLGAAAARLAPVAARPYAGLLGDALQLDAAIDHASDELVPLQLQLKSGALDLALRGELGPARLRLPGEGLVLHVAEPTPAALAALQTALPAGTSIGWSGALALVLRDLDLPVGGSSLDAAAVLPLANGALELALPRASYRDAALTAAGLQLELVEPKLALVLRAGQPAEATLSAQLAGATVGAIAAHATLRDLGALAGGALPPVDLELKATGVSTAFVDAYTGRAGMMADVLGSNVDLELGARGLSKTSGELTGELHSPLARAKLSGRMGTALLVSVEQQRTDLDFALTALSSQRVVGSLLPMLVQVRPSEPDQRASLLLEQFALPLDGDLGKLSGRATLDLGSVDFGFLPGIAALLAPGLASKAQRLGPYSLSIDKGVVRYDKLVIEIGGKPLAFSGSCDLGRAEMKLSVGLPLAYLGKGVNDVIEKNRQYLSPDLVVPLELSGSWKSPRVSIGKDFVKKLAEDALKNGLLNGLLDGLGGKKK